MSNLSNLTGKFRARKDGFHESSASKVIKRPRESLVCNQCRASKLRCDRAHPCGNCVKRNGADACKYDGPAASKANGTRQIGAEDRLTHLESMVKELMQNQVTRQPDYNALSSDLAIASEMPHPPLGLHGDKQVEQAAEGRYVGSTHWSAILDDIHELKVALGGPSGAQGTDDSTTSDGSVSQSDVIFGSSHDYSAQKIISEYLPPRVEIDRFISMYFRGEGFIIPFIHTFQFRRQYEEFWANTAVVNPLWLSILFSMCYIATMIGGSAGSYKSSKGDLAIRLSQLHIAAGKCLVAGKYYQPQRFAPEALAIYAHCKNIRSLDTSREAGTLFGMVVRLGYEMGYHREPDTFGSYTVFEGEMRRRFWACCKQMDFMVSFQLGLPSNICLENCDIRSPRNLLDSDFDEGTKALPESRPENEATGLLWFIVKDRMMISFSKVCQDVLSFKERSEEEVFRLDQEIRYTYTTTPDVLRTRPFPDSITDAPFLVLTRHFIEFMHLKSLCVLHRRYMAQGNGFSTMACIEAGTRLVSQFISIYKEFSPGGQLHVESWMLNNFTMNDFLLGVMVLCLVIYIRRKAGPQGQVIDETIERQMLVLLEQSHAICVEQSEACRDGRRVSHAIHLTLSGWNNSSILDKVALPGDLKSPVRLSNSQPVDRESQPGEMTTSTLQHQPGSAQREEAAFGLLDPFNFIGSDIENIDWTTIDAQILGEDAWNMELYPPV